MNTEFFNALDALEAERGISKAHMMEKIEAALTRAYQREKGGLDNVKVVMDEAKKDIKVYQVKRIVEVVENFETEITLEDAKKINRKYTMGDLADNLRMVGIGAPLEIKIGSISSDVER